jgi:hypothetical protein
MSAVAEEFGIAAGSSGDALGRHLNMEVGPSLLRG